MATDFSRLTVLELRQELKRRNLPQTGKKADLVDRLTAFDNEQTARGPDGHDAPDDHHEARDSPPQKDGTQDLLPQDSSATAPTLQPSVAEDVPQASADNRDVGDSSTAAQDLLSGQGLSTENKIDQAAGAEPETATEIIQDTANRKRRSRSPPPTEDESSRKRARPGERDNAQPIDTTDIAGPSSDTKDGRLELPDSQEYGRGSRQEQEHDRRQSRELTPPNFHERQVDIADEPTADSDKDVPPAQHLATPALYIKNFMRPLREPVLRDYLIELAALPRSAPDPDCLVDFYLDQIRTHAFVRFSSVSAASRVRTALHGTVWPDERNRKALWVDFIPDDKVVEWAERERSEGGRASSGRWEVQYEADNDGKITARLVNADMEPVARNSRQPLGPPAVPTGPARSNPAVEGAPLGPRGRGANHYRQQPPLPPPPALSAGGDRSVRTTRAYPPLQYKPVSDELAERRLANMNSFITKDRHRDLGRPDEINRYTFEDGDGFVDRGKEAFIGIRPPHRERERRRLGIGRGNRGLARRPAPSPRSPRDDQGYRGGRNDYDRDRDRDRNDDRRYRQRDDRDFDRRGDRYDDVPRSRFNGQPLPTYSGQRGGGPRFGGGGRRDRY